MKSSRSNYYDDRREIEWEKFDSDLAELAINLVGAEFNNVEQIPKGLRFEEAYTLKLVDNDRKYLENEEDTALIFEYDTSSTGYNEEFVDDFVDTFSDEEKVEEKMEENFGVLLR